MLNCETCKYNGVSDVCKTCQQGQLEHELVDIRNHTKHTIQYVSMDREELYEEVLQCK